jgi:hypothetical protein
MTRGTNLMQQLWFIIINYLYMFRASISLSSGVQVVCYCIWCSAQGVVAVVARSRCLVLCTVCKFITDMLPNYYLLLRFIYTHSPFCLGRQPQWARASSFTRFLDHIQRRTTIGRTPLDEWSARRWDLYLTTHNTCNRQTNIHAPDGLRTLNLSRQAAADPRLRPRGHWDRNSPFIIIHNLRDWLASCLGRLTLCDEDVHNG